MGPHGGYLVASDLGFGISVLVASIADVPVPVVVLWCGLRLLTAEPFDRLARSLAAGRRAYLLGIRHAHALAAVTATAQRLTGPLMH